MFVKSSRFKQVCQLLLSLIVAKVGSQSRNEINTHMEHLVQKHNDLL